MKHAIKKQKQAVSPQRYTAGTCLGTQGDELAFKESMILPIARCRRGRTLTGIDGVATRCGIGDGETPATE
jgi:hypothetical protein